MELVILALVVAALFSGTLISEIRANDENPKQDQTFNGHVDTPDESEDRS